MYFFFYTKRVNCTNQIIRSDCWLCQLNSDMSFFYRTRSVLHRNQYVQPLRIMQNNSTCVTGSALEDCSAVCHYEGEVNFHTFSWNFSSEFKNA